MKPCTAQINPRPLSLNIQPKSKISQDIDRASHSKRSTNTTSIPRMDHHMSTEEAVMYR